MKKIIINALLFGINSFGLFTEWYLTIPVDGVHTKMWGFPLPFVSESWHTSMGLQVFVLEFVLDFFTYCLFWFLLLYSFRKHIQKMPLLLSVVLWANAILIILFAVFVLTLSDTHMGWYRDFDMKVLDKGLELPWFIK